MDAIKSVKELRENSNREATRKLADIPYLFGEIRQTDSNYLIVPRVSSERRNYIPIGFVTPDVIASDAVQICLPILSRLVLFQSDDIIQWIIHLFESIVSH